jgi:hypothetical protein
MTERDVEFLKTGNSAWDDDVHDSHVVLARNDTSRGIFGKHKNDTTDSIIWNQPIVNCYEPEIAYVFNNGNYVVTLDDWSYNGDGDTVIVVYNKEGRLYKNYTLESLLPEKIIKKIDYDSYYGRRWRNEYRVDEDSMLFIFTTTLTTANFWSSKSVVDTFRLNLETGKIVNIEK